jgi:hypothetical protein
MSVSEAEPTINNNVLVETSLTASINENPQLNSSDSESESEKITDSHFNVSSKRNKRIKLNYKKLKTNRTDIQQNDTHTHSYINDFTSTNPVDKILTRNNIDLFREAKLKMDTGFYRTLNVTLETSIEPGSFVSFKR